MRGEDEENKNSRFTVQIFGLSGHNLLTKHISVKNTKNQNPPQLTLNVCDRVVVEDGVAGLPSGECVSHLVKPALQ